MLKQTFALIGLTVSLGANAATYDISSYDNGWYGSDGTHFPANDNILAGPTYNNFFAYDLSGLSGTVTSATLTIFGENGVYIHNDISVTYDVYGVTTPVASLINGTGGISAYNDLESGSLYGSTNIVTTPNQIISMPTVTINLSGAALTDLTSSLGGLFAVGGNSDASTYLWGNSSGTPASELTLEVAQIPLPAATWLFGSALLGLRLVKRKKA